LGVDFVDLIQCHDATQELALLQQRQASLGRTIEIDPPSEPC